MHRAWLGHTTAACTALKPRVSRPRKLRTLFPAVQALDLSQARAVCDDHMALLATLPRLAQLNLKRCRELTDAGLARLVPAAGRLRRLSLARCYGLTDAGMALLAQHFAALQSLNIKWCYR